MINERTLQAIETTNAILEARSKAREVAATPMDVSALAQELGAPFGVEVSGQVWTAAAPPSDAGDLTRDDYLRAVVAGLMAELAKGKGAVNFRFRAAPLLPPAACHDLTFLCEALPDPFDPKVRVTVLGDRLAVPVGAR